MDAVKAIQGVHWDDLAVVLAGIRHGSLNQAAAALDVGQSTASRRLVRLEEQLGTQLFDRTPEGLLPTQFALELAPLAELIEGHMADIELLAAGRDGAPQGRVRLALPDGLASQWLIPRLDDFFAQCPDVEIDIVIGHAVVDIVRREADMALRFVRPTAPALLVQKLGAIDVAAYAHPCMQHDDARSLRWIMFDDPHARYVETQWVLQHVAPRQVMRVSLWNALFAAICQGLGPGLVSPLVAEPAGLVRVATELPPPPSRDLYLVVHQSLRDVPRVRVFRDWLAEQARTSFALFAGQHC